jgi:hypothetical protein
MGQCLQRPRAPRGLCTRSLETAGLDRIPPDSKCTKHRERRCWGRSELKRLRDGMSGQAGYSLWLSLDRAPRLELASQRPRSATLNPTVSKPTPRHHSLPRRIVSDVHVKALQFSRQAAQPRGRYPCRAVSIVATSFFMFIMAAKTRCASAPPAAMASINTRGMSCQESPQWPHKSAPLLRRLYQTKGRWSSWARTSPWWVPSNLIGPRRGRQSALSTMLRMWPVSPKTHGPTPHWCGESPAGVHRAVQRAVPAQRAS